MLKLEDLKAKALDIVAKQQALIDTAATDKGRDLTEAEQLEFEGFNKELERLNAQIGRQQSVEKSLATFNAVQPSSRDVRGTVKDITGGAMEVRSTQMGVTQPNLTSEQIVGVCAWAAAKNKAEPKLSSTEHLAKAGFQTIADEAGRLRQEAIETRAVQTLAGGAGDNTIFTPLSTDYIETLRNASAFLAAGPLEVDMSYGSLKIPGGASAATGAYGQEGAAIGYSQLTTRTVSMSAKHLRMVTAISNYNIAISPLAIASIVGSDVTLSLGLSQDAAGLRGDGTGFNPTGIRNLANAGSIFAATASVVAPTFTAIDTDARTAMTKYAISNIPRRRPFWIMSNRVFLYLQNLRDTIGAGAYVYPKLQDAKPTWVGNIPVIVSEQVPSNLGAGTNESEIYLADFGYIMMGVARSLVLTSSQEAAYTNAGGTLVSSFGNDETVIRGVMSHDFGVRYDKAVAVITTVKWGA